ncbi:MAG: hypothetical protein K6C94_06725 [Candidatus Gastranaerophilales bacterium]|nr:hypothetical protein [Candidatus Gastranaerophilales bacterium]
MKNRNVLHLKGFENQILEVNASFWTVPTLYQNGTKCEFETVKGKRCFYVTDDNGETQIVIMHINIFDPYNPQFITKDGNITGIYPPFTKIQKIISVMPIIPLFCFTNFYFTFIPALISILTVFFFMRKVNSPLKHIAIGFVLLVQYLLWFLQLLPIILKILSKI